MEGLMNTMSTRLNHTDNGALLNRTVTVKVKPLMSNGKYDYHEAVNEGSVEYVRIDIDGYALAVPVDAMESIMRSKTSDLLASKKDSQILYDVCNDYTLDPCTQAVNLTGEYKKHESPHGVTYVHVEYGEIHYFRGMPGLTGKNYFDVC